MKKQTFKLAIIAAASFGWISLAAAQGPEGPGGGRGDRGGPGMGPNGERGPRIGMIARHLGLTDEQKTQWKAIHEQEHTTAEPLRKAAGEARAAFHQAMESEAADAATLGQAALAMRNAQQALQAHQKATFERVKAILTPEQLAKVEEMEKRGPRRGGKRLGPGGPDGEGPRHRGPRGSK